MDDQQAPLLELNGHDLERYAPFVVAQVDQARFGAGGSLCRRRLLETQTGVLDDMAGTMPRYPMPRRRASPSDVHTSTVSIMSDNISMNGLLLL